MHRVQRGHKGIYKTMKTMHEAVMRLHWWHSLRAVGSSAQLLPGRLQVAESIAEGDQLKAGPTSARCLPDIRQSQQWTTHCQQQQQVERTPAATPAATAGTALSGNSRCNR
jgi:hypothetical protein